MRVTGSSPPAGIRGSCRALGWAASITTDTGPGTLLPRYAASPAAIASARWSPFGNPWTIAGTWTWTREPAAAAIRVEAISR
jgi:hypothetical protein